MRLPPFALFIALLLASVEARAARPFVTDDARIVDKDGCQVETFVKRQRRFDENEFWLLPACNPWGAELTAGHSRVDSMLGDTRTTILQAKMLLKPLVTNGSGFALTLGTFYGAATSPYLNVIGSFSFADDRVVVHANIGALHDNVAKISRGTWGAGAEVLLIAPRLYGIIESYGQRGEKPTAHNRPAHLGRAQPGAGGCHHGRATLLARAPLRHLGIAAALVDQPRDASTTTYRTNSLQGIC